MGASSTPSTTCSGYRSPGPRGLGAGQGAYPWLAALAFGLLVSSAVAYAGSESPPRVGFQVFEPMDGAAGASAAVVMRYTGPISHPFVDNLRELLVELGGRYPTLILELDSEGGEPGQTDRAVELLRAARESSMLKTFVAQGARCLSACVLLFLQGEQRIAGGATLRSFHGARRAFTNLPSPEPTRAYVERSRSAGVNPAFLRMLLDDGYLERAGDFRASGHELVHVHEANVITRLLEPWQPRTPVPLPFDPSIRPR